MASKCLCNWSNFKIFLGNLQHLNTEISCIGLLYLTKSIHGLQFGSWILESFVGIWINNLSVLQVLLHIVIQRQLFDIAFVLFERSLLPTSVA